MFARIIVSENDGAYFDVEALIVGNDELEVLAKTDAKFREIIKKKEEDQDDPMTDEEIDEAVREGSYFDDLENITYEAHVFAPNEVVMAFHDYDFDKESTNDAGIQTQKEGDQTN